MLSNVTSKTCFQSESALGKRLKAKQRYTHEDLAGTQGHRLNEPALLSQKITNTVNHAQVNLVEFHVMKIM